MTTTFFFVFISLLTPFLIIFGIVYLALRTYKKSKEEQSEMLTPKELAIELGMFLALTVTVFTFVIITFAIIDKLYPDVLVSSYSYSAQTLAESSRSAIAAILIIFPVYLALAWTRARHFVKHSERKEVSAFKWQHYVAIFLSAIFIIGTLIVVLYNYLNGEVTEASALKALVVVVLSLILGAYYYYSLNRNYKEKTILPLIATILGLVLVLGVVFYSFSVFGSPAEVRKGKFDEKRLDDLSSIQMSIVNHWQTNYSLPVTLAVLEGGGLKGGMSTPNDPETNESYTYEIIKNSEMVPTVGRACTAFYPGKFSTATNLDAVTCQMPTSATFKLCADFNTVRKYDQNGVDVSTKMVALSEIAAGDMLYYPGYYNRYDRQNPNWNHEAEYTCFERTINPSDFPSYY